jgi:hypothetical protein
LTDDGEVQTREHILLARQVGVPTSSFGTPDSPAAGWPWEYLLLLVWGHRKNFTEVAERAAPWAHASTILVPDSDVFDDEPGDQLAEPSRSRERFTPEDMLAVAFNGLARRNMKGSIQPGTDVAEMAANLRGLPMRSMHSIVTGLGPTSMPTSFGRSLVPKREKLRRDPGAA